MKYYGGDKKNFSPDSILILCSSAEGGMGIKKNFLSTCLLPGPRALSALSGYVIPLFKGGVFSPPLGYAGEKPGGRRGRFTLKKPVPLRVVDK